MIKKVLFVLMQIFFISQGYSYSIVFIHLGKDIPSHLPVAIRQARLFNKDCEIYLVCNKSARFVIEDEVHLTTVFCESLPQSAYHKHFNDTTKLDRRSLNGFWHYTTERFYYLHELVKEHDLTDVFHLENDVMLYRDLNELLPIFHAYYRGMVAATYENVERCVPGLLYISAIHPLNEVIEFVANRANLNETDMDSVGRFINYKHKIFIDTLPVIFPNYGIVRGYRFAVTDDRFYNHFVAFDSLFDAAAMGQYLGGESPIHNAVPTPGFINPLSVYYPSHFHFEWERDAEDRWVPFIVFERERKRMNNLHIHSKNLQAFYSLQNPFPQAGVL